MSAIERLVTECEVALTQPAPEHAIRSALARALASFRTDPGADKVSVQIAAIARETDRLLAFGPSRVEARVAFTRALLAHPFETWPAK